MYEEWLALEHNVENGEASGKVRETVFEVLGSMVYLAALEEVSS